MDRSRIFLISTTKWSPLLCRDTFSASPHPCNRLETMRLKVFFSHQPKPRNERRPALTPRKSHPIHSAEPRGLRQQPRQSRSRPTEEVPPPQTHSVNTRPNPPAPEISRNHSPTSIQRKVLRDVSGKKSPQEPPGPRLVMFIFRQINSMRIFSCSLTQSSGIFLQQTSRRGPFPRFSFQNKI